MTIDSRGYAGTIMPGVEWAEFQRIAGSTYAVADPSAALATPVVGGVEVGPGIIGGQGVADNITAAETVPLTAPGSGIEYHVIAAHRDWQVSGVTTMVAITAGTSLPSSLPAMDNQPGIIDDQPLWLVSMSAGSNTPVIVWDLRQIGGPNVYHVSADPPLAMFAPLAEMGVVLKRGITTVTRRVSETSGNGFWDISPLEFFGTDVFPDPGGGNWTTSSGPLVAAYLNDEGTSVDLKIEFRRRTGVGSLVFSPQGGVNDELLGSVATAFRPRYSRAIPGIYEASGGGTFGCTLRFEQDGELYLVSGAPDSSIDGTLTGVSVFAAVQYAI